MGADGVNPHNHTNPASPAFPCAFCGYNLSGVKLGGKCPECGNVVNFVANRPYQSNGAAVASLVLGIVSVVGCVAYGVLSIVCGPLAIYFAGKATKNIQRGQAVPSTRGMATGGRICGIIGTCL